MKDAENQAEYNLTVILALERYDVLYLSKGNNATVQIIKGLQSNTGNAQKPQFLLDYNDNIIVERDTGNYVWIDFDFDFDAVENPFSLDIFGLGNILLYALGKGFHNLHMIMNDRMIYGNLIDRLEPGDFSLLDKWRLVNLKKIYPYFPTLLNDILMHFSAGAGIYYETVDEIIEDLNRCMYLIFRK